MVKRHNNRLTSSWGCRPSHGGYSSPDSVKYCDGPDEISSRPQKNPQNDIVIRKRYYQELSAKNPGEVEYDVNKRYSEKDLHKFIKIPHENSFVKGLLWNVFGRGQKKGTSDKTHKIFEILLENGEVIEKRVKE